MTRLRDPSRRRLRSWVPLAALALVAYVPVLLSNPGQVGGDTKSYLTLDPARWLSRVAFVWQDAIGAGGVTHQNIGYLWPMGPWFWVFDRLGLPMWLAQRLWLGTVIFVAGAGVLWLVRRWVDPRIAVAAAFFYMLSPYLLHYSERMSVLLLPWAGLPWMIGLTARSRDEGTWRAPAFMALLVSTIGGINATSILLVGLGPLLWLVYTIVLPHSAGTVAESVRLRIRRAGTATLRIAVLCALTNAWWIAGLRSQGSYGLPVLGYTETYKTVANSSAAQEMLRGFGHWYFYGSDRIGAWVRPSVSYTENLVVLALSFVVPILALCGLAFVRHRHRTFFMAMVVMGLLIGVGAHPWESPSVLGGLFKAFTRSEAGLALRSTPRALPLMEMGLAVGFGAGVAAVNRVLSRWWAGRAPAPPRADAGTATVRARPPRWLAPGVVAVACVLVALNIAPFFQGQATADSLARDEELPGYWLDATAELDGASHDTRVLEVPGSDFAAYRWGDIVDPLTPGLIDRPYLARELIPNGQPASAALLLALDRRYQEGVAEDAALAPLARLLGVGDVVLRNDLEYERFNTPRPYVMWNRLTSTPGLGAPEGFGEPGRNDALEPRPLLDNLALAEPPDQPETPPVAIFPVQDPLPISRTVPAETPMLVAGDAEGLVDLAALGLLDPEQAILYSASFADDPDALREQLDRGAALVLTDTNAKRGLRWGSVRENQGAVERVDEAPLRYDPSDNDLEVFPDQSTDDQTVAVQRGGTVDATAYGNVVSFTPEDRPYMAFDGDLTTAWSAGALEDAVGERIRLTLDEPASIDRLTLVQAPGNRHVTRARVRVGDESVVVDLGPESLSAPGQTVEVPPTEADTVSIEVLETDPGGLASYDSYSGVGFAEIEVPGVSITETLRLPTSLLSVVGRDDLEHPLTVVVTRNRTDPSTDGRPSPEREVHRELELPSARSFTLVGDVRIDPSISSEGLAALLGQPDLTAVSASSWLSGDLADRGRGAFDHDPTTWWTPRIGDTAGSWVQYDVPAPEAPGRLSVTFAADGRHSVPATLSVQADAATVATVALPDAPDGDVGATRTVEVPLPEGTSASSWRVSVDSVHERVTRQWLGDALYALPVAIAGVDGLAAAPREPAGSLDTGCRADLVSVDGEPVPVRVTGDVESALDHRALFAVGCRTVDAGPGTTTIDTVDGRSTGLSVDRVALLGAAGGTPVPAGDPPEMAAALAQARSDVTPSSASVTVDAQRPDRVELTVDGLDEDTWLVLGQSFSEGWSASSPELGHLGGPTLVQGYANGWPLPGTSGPVHVTLEWGPQKVVWAGIGVSGLGTLLCLVILVVGTVRGRRRPSRGPSVTAVPPSAVDAPVSAPLARPWTAAATAPSFGWRAPVALGVAVGIFALVNLPLDRPVLALALAAGLGVAVGAVIRAGRGLGLLAAIPPAALVVAGVYVVVKEARGGYLSLEWPQIFDPVHVLGVLSVLALAAVAVVSAWRDEREIAEGDDPVS